MRNELDSVGTIRPLSTRAYAALTGFLCLLSAVFPSSAALAAFKVNSPYVEKGVVGIELKNQFDFDSDSQADRFRQHQLELGYGFTDWWTLEVEMKWEKEQDRGYDHIATSIENTFQFFDAGEYWVDAGAKLEYVFSHESRAANKVEAQLLLKKQYDHWAHTVNFIAEKEVGEYSEAGLEGAIAWRTEYLYDRAINPGIEYYAEFGELRRTGGWDRQEHYIGPAIKGKLPHNLAYDLGWLFGASDAAADHVLKLNLEYEFQL